MRKAVKTASDHRDVDMIDPMSSLALQFMFIFLLMSDLNRLREEIKRFPKSNKLDPQSTSTYKVIFIDQRKFERVEMTSHLFAP